jgi:predicted PurR-regulated permease PerM
MAQKDSSENDYTFSQKVWITGSIFALIVVLLLLLKATFNVFLLILAGIIIAVFFRGLSSLIERISKWRPSLSLAISIIGTLLIVIAVFWLIGAKVQTQLTQLSDTLPSTIDNAKEQLNKSAIGQKIVEKASSPKTQERAKAVASTFFRSTFGVLGDVYVVLFLGIFFTVSPQLYIKGIINLVPKQKRRKAADVLNTLGDSLKKWLKGTLFAMLVVFVLTSIGLLIIGVPMWLALALIAGILNFIPNFGPLIAMIPAVLVALTQGPATAGFVAGLYILVQVTESNFITPQIQKKLINIPPAIIIISQLLMGVLTGGWGLVLATPLMLILILLVQETYIKHLNKE